MMLGLNDRFYDTKRLFDFTYENYSIKEIAKYGDTIARFVVGKATADTAILDVIVDSDISTIVPNNDENIPLTISINEDIVAPIDQNQILGTVTYCADGLIYSTNIVASHSVEKIPYDLYIIITVGIFIIVLIIFTIVCLIFKKYWKEILAIEATILIGVCIIIYPFIKKDIDNSVTRMIFIKNDTGETYYSE